ncbi:hypothetical protein DWX31_10395 [Hungatella hathewayi]|uniref:Uncharacterized protein n=1 Tax=Hungatella hathewayi TaxID=154046 RepID=A0A3E3DMX5_9FIRM|nr:hypothetical protein DWX31_10395 [Hungatella hathewayi]
MECRSHSFLAVPFGVRHFCFNKINENSPSLYRWEMNRKNKLSVSGGQISPTDMRSKQSGQPDKMAA